jgi:DHA2 family multidrug resistance protein-like MFS transporter
MDLTVLNLAVPHITADLRPTGAQLLWIVDIYGFLLAGALVTMGALGDQIGRRRLLMIGAVAFGLASLLAAFSTTAAMLIVSRALLGLAAATLAPSTLSLIRTMFEDERQRSFAIGIWMASFSVGGAVGPLVGGILLEHFWWGSVFLIAIPVMVLLLASGPFLLPEHRDLSGERVDLASAILATAAMLTLVYAIKHVAVGDLSGLSVGALIIGVALSYAFIVRQKRLTTPLLDLDLFRTPGFSGVLIINLAGFFLAFSTLLFLAQYLQLALDMGAFEAGLWTLFSAAGFVVGSVIAPWCLRWMRSASVIATSLTTATVGFALLAASLWSDSFALLMAATFLFSVGLAPVFALSADLIVGAAPEEKAGSAAAIAETSSELGGALGIAILGSVVAAVYQVRTLNLLPAQATASKTALTDGISNAFVQLENFPAEQAGVIREVIIHAYSDAFASVALLSAAIALIIATAARTLRKAAR